MSEGQSNGGFIIHDQKDKVPTLTTVQAVPGGSPTKPKAIPKWKIFAIVTIITLSVVLVTGAGSFFYVFMEIAANESTFEVDDFDESEWSSSWPAPADSDEHGVGGIKAAGLTKVATDIRLVGGNNIYEGRVELLHDGVWGTVCHDQWNAPDAEVACRQLGYGAKRNAWRHARFGEGTGPIYFDNLKCVGTEERLEQCNRNGGVNRWGRHNCDHTEDASLRCWAPVTLDPCETDPCRNGGQCITGEGGEFECECRGTWGGDLCADTVIRLVNGTTPFDGTVEVFFNGRWGTVCDDFWDAPHAEVVCRQLGHPGAVEAHLSAHFGQGIGPILLDNVKCVGDESRLEDCPHRPWTQHNCDHSEDAGVTCQNTVRLVNGGTEYAGRVEVLHNGEWGTICHDFWDMPDAEVVCRQLGYPGAVAAPGSASFDQGAGPIVLDNVKCVGSESRIEECPHRAWGQHNCDHSKDAGVVCRNPNPNECLANPCRNNGECVDLIDGYRCDCVVGYSGKNCTQEVNSDNIRLAGGSSFAGRVEIFVDGAWGTVCDDAWDLKDATVACNELGFPGGAVVAYKESYFGAGSGSILLDELRCRGGENALSDCAHEGVGNHDCSHSEDAGVMCRDPGLEIKPDLLDTGMCGTRPVVDRIVNGQDASVGEWPWSAYLRDGNGNFVCGAALINNEWAITAAHCKDVISSIVFGDIAMSSATNTHQESTVTVISHPEYNDDTIDNDIALLKLDTPVTYTDVVRPVCLGVNDNELEEYGSRPCYVVGWGALDYGDYGADHLQELETNVIATPNCNASYGHLTDNMMCTSTGTTSGSCQGDSGGPLVCNSNGRWHLVGVTSHGYECARVNYPDILARVSRYPQWIAQTISRNENIACTDVEANCPYWAETGQCDNNPGYMLVNCKLSCGICDDDADACSSSPCENGAECVVEGDSYECSCTEGWSGENCDIHSDACSSFPCENGAECAIEGAGYECSCTEGWSGVNCDTQSACTDAETNCPYWAESGECDNNPGYMLVNCPLSCNTCDGVQPCDFKPCQNGASCENVAEDDFVCQCPSGFAGKTCDVDTSPCGTSPCPDNADCVVEGNGYLCPCRHGWTGTNCDTEIPSELRLVGGSRSSGRVEMFVDGAWGTICDDAWDINDATVVCNELGYPGGAVAAYKQSYFGAGSGSILLDEVQCTGTENRLASCAHNGLGSHDCTHSEDAGVMCRDPGIQIKPDLLNTGSCGTRPVVDRIVNGQDANVGEWPWAAYLRNSDGYFVCGAALLNNEWAITAAHCKDVISSIVFGDIAMSYTTNTHQESTVTVISHPEYNDDTIDNDICLLKLDTPVTYTDYVRPVCLGVTEDEVDDYPQGSCYVVGWGALDYGGAGPDHLQELGTNLITNSNCNDNYGHITDNMICSSTGTTSGSCQGDSGGPLVCNNNGQWQLVGVTSHGYECARVNYPDVLARVSQYPQWIAQTISLHGGNTSK